MRAVCAIAMVCYFFRLAIFLALASFLARIQDSNLVSYTVGSNVTEGSTVMGDGALWLDRPAAGPEVVTLMAPVLYWHERTPMVAAEGHNLTANSTAVPLSGVTISGQLTDHVDTSYIFTATISPITATQPVTYRWSAYEQSPVNTGSSNSVTFSWSNPGTKFIWVEAHNAMGVVGSSHAVVIAEPETELAELIELRRIWDAAPHNAFTDLIYFKGRWYAAFREGATHTSPDGAVRVITSGNGNVWASAASFRSTVDLRDPKLTITPDERLMASAGAMLGPIIPPDMPYTLPVQTLVWFSSDGTNWSEPVEIGAPDMWLWRITWHKGIAYSLAFSTTYTSDTTGYGEMRLYTSVDGVHFDTQGNNIFPERKVDPNESAQVFLDDDTALSLVRLDLNTAHAMLGTAVSPYTNWSWKDLGVRLGGPNMLRLPDGRIVVAARLYPINGWGKVRTSLLWLDPLAGTLEEFLPLPSGGDTSYPGLVLHDGLLWMSYYSTHEGKTSIYLAKVKLPGVDAIASKIYLPLVLRWH